MLKREIKTQQIKIYTDDKELLKERFKGSYADIIHSLLWGTKDDFKEVVKVLLTEELQTITPYFKKRLDSIEQMIEDKLK